MTDELERHIASLPSEVTPERDLWPEIEARLEPRETTATVSWWRGETGHRVRQATAAMMFLALGAMLSQWFWPSGDHVEEEGERYETVSTRAVGEIQPASSRTFSVLRADLVEATDALRADFATRREELSPVAVQVVERNLALIDEAILEIETVLDEEPGNAELELQLLAHHRRQLDLLQRLMGA
ncbi:MAG: hypothetical protein AAGD38_15360 [Acidobacteriota bacterium]